MRMRRPDPSADGEAGSQRFFLEKLFVTDSSWEHNEIGQTFCLAIFIIADIASKLLCSRTGIEKLLPYSDELC